MEEKKKGAPDYMPLYVSLFLILVAFFAALLANSTFEKKRILQAIGSIRGGFGVLEGGSKITKGKELLFPSADIIEKKHETESTFREFMKMAKEGKGFSIFSSEKVYGILKRISSNKLVEIRRYKKGIIITILDLALFPPGSAKILPSAKPLLHDIATIIKNIPYEVIISGHTDNTPCKGKFKDNWELSAQRALSVLRYLIEYEKILPEKLKAAGFSQYRPRYPNDTKEHKKLNRRVEISFEIL